MEGYFLTGIFALSIWLIIELIRRKRLQREVDALRRQRTEFIANVSHELKTPLTSIQGYTETLKDGALNDPDQAALFLEKIEANAERLAALTQDILGLSRLEAIDTPLKIEEIKMESFLQNIKDQFNFKLDQKRQVLEVQNEVPSVRADRKLLGQALCNLVENANRYCPEGARIQIQVVSWQKWIRFDVIDNGPGVSEEDLPRVFERFYRADKSRTRVLGGTGLGLAIVKHTMISHGGRVTAQNEPEGGMRFSLFLPKTS